MSRRTSGISFSLQCRAVNLPNPVTEFRFHPVRKWRFDYAWPMMKFAMEVDGGGWVNGRHSRGSGIEKDCEKFAEAMILGWRVLRVTPAQIRSGQAIQWVDRLTCPWTAWSPQRGDKGG